MCSWVRSAIIEMSLLHLQAIGVGPESAIGIKAFVHAPADKNVFALSIEFNRHAVKFDVEFDEFAKLSA